MSGCGNSEILLYYKWKELQPRNRDDSWYLDQYQKYYWKATKACRDKQRKAKRGY